MAAVLLAGAFGQRNPGDEALLRAFVEGLPDHALVATSVDPVHTESRHGIEAIQSRDVRSVARRCAGGGGARRGGGLLSPPPPPRPPPPRRSRCCARRAR